MKVVSRPAPRCGSRKEHPESEWRKPGFVPSEEDLESLSEQISDHPYHAAHHHYGRSRFSGRDKSELCSFNIKAHGAFFGNNSIYEDFGFTFEESFDVVRDAAEWELECFAESLKEGFPIEEWTTAGQGGGYLILRLSGDPTEDLNCLINRYLDETFPTPWGQHVTDEFKEELRETWSRSLEFLKIFPEIEKRVEEAKKAFEEYVASREFWEEFLEANPDWLQRRRERERRKSRSYHDEGEE